MSGGTGAKENANPIVHEIEETPTKRANGGALERWNLSVSNDLPITLDLPERKIYTAEDRGIYNALVEIANATNGKGVSLLTQAGLNLFNESSQPIASPMYLAEKLQQPQSNSCNTREAFTAEEIFHIVRNIQDPEHPLTLEQLNVVNRHHIVVQDNYPDMSMVHVRFTPTIPHCSMATLIGLCIRVKLLRSLPPRFKVHVTIQPGTHASEAAVGKQLADKERVCAALENEHLLGVVNKCVGEGMNMQ